ncbi:MAG: LysM peptidoglycan-binding domain-containing protein [bacterium]
MRSLANILLLVAAAGLMPGCFATAKHVRTIETDITRQAAWTDQKMTELSSDIEALRSENDALRQRTTDLESQISSLGGEVSTRITELSERDRKIDLQLAETSQKADALGAAQTETEREMLDRMNVILEEVLAENKKLRGRIDKLESSAFTFGRTHVVKPGESVAGIATKYGVTAQDIVRANGLSDANVIQVGQELVIPGAE